MVTEITDADIFNRLLNNNSTVVCKFHATWCGPCKTYAGTFSTVSESYDDVPFISVDVDALPEVVSTYGVRSVPTTLVFSNGAVKHVKTGAQSQDSIVQMINS